MIKLNSPADCCGCTACASICAHEAITMRPDALGFMYPQVDTAKCVDCGLCDKVCAFNDHYDTSLNLEKAEAWAVRHKNMDEVMTSRSGAAFIAITDVILRQGGVVYGVGYKEHFRVTHKRATTAEERNEFKGSKYVQSDLTGIFREVRKDLKEGRIVLFSGTPCQTAGLNSFVGKRLRERLYLVDMICHGVPGPYLWRDYLAYLEKKQGAEIIEVDFRDKRQYGWWRHIESYKFAGGGKVSFTFIFYKHIMFRHSCGKCHYCNTRRPSDITLGDFWGWEKSVPEMNKDDKGLSLVLVNTEKGRQLFDAAKDDVERVAVKLEDCMQPNLQQPSAIHPDRMRFERDFERKGLVYVMKKYGDWGLRCKLRTKLHNARVRLERIIKRK